MDKVLKTQGHDIQLITEGELHAIRQEWLNDPNEPDWNDSLPKIYKRVYGHDLDWQIDERVRFAGADAGLLHELATEHGIVPEMVMKLIDLEISFEGMGRRQNVQKKVESILQQDWGTFEEIKEKYSSVQKKNQFDMLLKEKEDVELALDALSNDFDRLENILNSVTSNDEVEK